MSDSWSSARRFLQTTLKLSGSNSMIRFVSNFMSVNISRQSVHRLFFSLYHRNAITRGAMQNLDKQIWKSRIAISTKLNLYNTCSAFHPSFCMALRDVLQIDTLDQWCLRKLLEIKWYHHVRNDEVRRTTGQPCLSAIVQARRLSLFGHIARMPDETDAKSIITASPSEDWRRPPGRPRTTWMKTIQQDLRSNNL